MTGCGCRAAQWTQDGLRWTQWAQDGESSVLLDGSVNTPSGSQEVQDTTPLNFHVFFSLVYIDSAAEATRGATGPRTGFFRWMSPQEVSIRMAACSSGSRTDNPPQRSSC